MSHVAWSVCVCLCWARGWAVQKRPNRSRCCLEDWLKWVRRMMHSDGGHPRSPNRKGNFSGGNMSAHYNQPTHECTAYCSPAAVGECASPAHARDECIRRRQGWQDNDAAFCQITFGTSSVFSTARACHGVRPVSCQSRTEYKTPLSATAPSTNFRISRDLWQGS